MRRNAVLSALGALGSVPNGAALMVQFSRASSSATVPPKALPRQFGDGFVGRRGLKRQVARLGAVRPVGSQGCAGRCALAK